MWTLSRVEFKAVLVAFGVGLLLQGGLASADQRSDDIERGLCGLPLSFGADIDGLLQTLPARSGVNGYRRYFNNKMLLLVKDGLKATDPGFHTILVIQGDVDVNLPAKGLLGSSRLGPVILTSHMGLAPLKLEPAGMPPKLANALRDHFSSELTIGRAGAECVLHAKIEPTGLLRNALRAIELPNNNLTVHLGLSFGGDAGNRGVVGETTATLVYRHKDGWKDAFGVEQLTFNLPELVLTADARGDMTLGFEGVGDYRKENLAVLFETPANVAAFPVSGKMKFAIKKMGLGDMLLLMKSVNSRLAFGGNSDELDDQLSELTRVLTQLNSVAKLKNDKFSDAVGVDDNMLEEDFLLGLKTRSKDQFMLWFVGPEAITNLENPGLYLNASAEVLGKSVAAIEMNAAREEFRLNGAIDGTANLGKIEGINFGEVGLDGNLNIIQRPGRTAAEVNGDLHVPLLGSRDFTLSFSNTKMALKSPATCLTPVVLKADFNLSSPLDIDGLLAGLSPGALKPGLLISCSGQVFEAVAKEFVSGITNIAGDVAGGMSSAGKAVGCAVGLGGCSKPRNPDYIAANWKEKTVSSTRNQRDVGVASSGDADEGQDFAILVSDDNLATRVNNSVVRTSSIHGPAGETLLRADIHVSGSFVAVTESHKLYFHKPDNSNSWKEVRDMSARDVGINANHIWIVSNEPHEDGGFQVYRANYSSTGNFNWRSVNAKGMVKIDAGTDGTAFGIDESLDVYKIKSNGASRQIEDVKAYDVAVSGHDVLWIVSSNFKAKDGGGWVYQYRDIEDADEEGMTKFGGRRMAAISVGKGGILHGVGAGGAAWRGDLGHMAYYYKWRRVDNQGGHDIDIGTGGHTWKIRNDVAYRFTGSSWQSKGSPNTSQAMIAIDVAPNGDAVVVMGNGDVYHSKSSGWKKTNTAVKAKDVALTAKKMYLISDKRASKPYQNSYVVHEAPYNSTKLKGNHSTLTTDVTKTGKVRIDAGYFDEKGVLVGVNASNTVEVNFDRRGWNRFQGDSKQLMIDLGVHLDGDEDTYYGIGGAGDGWLHYFRVAEVSQILSNGDGKYIYGSWVVDKEFRALSNVPGHRLSVGPMGTVWVLTSDNKTYRRERIQYH